MIRKKARVSWVIVFFIIATQIANAQLADKIYADNIRSVKLFQTGNIFSYPVMSLNSTEALELHFDDMDGDVKNYYYTYQLCNADWTVSGLFAFDYIRGFQTNRIRTYRNSSIAYNNYMHYQALLPDRNCMPSRSGNYLLKVFLDDDTSQLVFTKRILVVDKKLQVGAQILAPFGGQYFHSYQRVQVAINTAMANLNVFSQQDIKLRVVQNYSWANSKFIDKPTIYRGNYFEYSDDALSFSAGREWRWIDLSSLRLMSDRMETLNKASDRTDVYIKPDADRSRQAYFYYKDINGLYSLENRDGYNPYWQSDYAFTHFTYLPPGNKPLIGKDIYLYGELTDFTIDEKSRMEFNEEKGVYEKTLFLKQGFYNYSYVTASDNAMNEKMLQFESTEGNFQETENSYLILVYYRPFGARADELIGFSYISSISTF